MHKIVTQETPGKVLTLLSAAVLSMFLMTAVNISSVTWTGNSGNAIPDPFSVQNVTAFIDQAAWVYSSAVHTFLIDPVKADFGFIPENLAWIKDNAELTLAVAVGLEDPLPQVSGAPPSQGQVAGAAAYYDNIFSLYTGQ